jgi:hypothetical protein
VPGYLVRFASVFGILLLASPLAAAEPSAEALPPPRPVLPPAVMAPPPLPGEMMLFARHDPYAVWQNYGIDRRGYWRPRVMYSAEGAYYYYNGAPYPWMTTHPETVRPYSIQPASFR